MTRSPARWLGALLALLLWSSAGLADDAGWRTDVIFLEAMPAERAAALYERVLGTPPGVRVVVGEAPQSLVVRDTPPRLARFRTLLEALDREGTGQLHLYVRPVVHRTPSELAALALEVFDAAADAPLKLVPDDRARRLVVQTTPATYRKLDALLRRLDVPDRSPDRRDGR